MSSIFTVDDLKLVVAVARHGSIGAAARELLVSQPSASARLATLERRLDLILFERDTTGARPTPAGLALVEEAQRVLASLSGLSDRVRAVAAASALRAGAVHSLSGVFFCPLDAALADAGMLHAVHQTVDHGDNLMRQVETGALDMAVVAVAEQIPASKALAVTPLGVDRLVVFQPRGSSWEPGQRWNGVMPFHCLDRRANVVERHIARAGGTPRLCATGEVAVLTARAMQRPALVAGGVARLHQQPEEAVTAAPPVLDFTIQMVTRAVVPDVVRALIPFLQRRMGLLGV